MGMIPNPFKKKEASPEATSRELLEQAQIQRAKMDLTFEEGVTTLKGLSCAINTMGEDRLVLDVYGIRNPGNFRGKYFSCYFRIREGKAGLGFYGFRARIIEVRKTSNGGIVFESSMPSGVERSQRRRSMRVSPELSWFDEIMFWNGARLDNAESEAILFGLRELRQTKLCRLENMSAGGVRLYFNREFCRQADFSPSMHDEFTLYLLFAQEIRNQPQELWLTGKAVRVVVDPITKDVDLGVEFSHAGRKSSTTGEVVWTAIQDNVAEELISRVFEWHSALYRERAGTAH